MNRYLKFFIASLLLIFVPIVNSVAQCAMCRASVSSTISDGRNDVGNGLNFGILYMLVFPYLIVAVGIYVWYRKAKQNQVNKLQMDERISRFRDLND